ncbi:zinc ribbon domain-containing protein [Prevotella sp. HUN102]|uniref:zinc-ribbon domain-containing protein n=1 Tax=Prevotella sp. HUN102 TaxID=1392486 RepID=UPI00048B3587|nr:zinc ribbon domain-containing protein [Prevotella sp. HUN102]
MKCPNCNTEIEDYEEKCPHCGENLHEEHNHGEEDEPTLRRSLVIFIIIGTIFLTGYGFFYYINHQHDPEYTQTAIEPDSTLADKFVVTFDTVAVDTAAVKDSTDIVTEEEADKVFSSIRGKTRRKSHSARRNDASGSASSDAASSASESSTSSSEFSSASASPAAPRPHVETIETE